MERAALIKKLKEILTGTSILFTAITVMESSMIVLGHIPAKADLGPYVHMLSRFLVCLIIVSAFTVFSALRSSNTSKRDSDSKVRFLLIYLVTMPLIFALVWFSGLFIELHPDAFKDIFVSFTTLYFGVIAFNVGVKYVKSRFLQRQE